MHGNGAEKREKVVFLITLLPDIETFKIPPYKWQKLSTQEGGGVLKSYDEVTH